MCYALAFRAVVSLLQEGADWFGFGFLKTWVMLWVETKRK